jgi:hypothetical protein
MLPTEKKASAGVTHRKNAVGFLQNCGFSTKKDFPIVEMQ